MDLLFTHFGWKWPQCRNNTPTIKVNRGIRNPGASTAFYRKKLFRQKVLSSRQSSTQYENFVEKCSAVSEAIKQTKEEIGSQSPRIEFYEVDKPFDFSKEPHYVAGKRNIAIALASSQTNSPSVGIVKSIVSHQPESPLLKFSDITNLPTQRLLGLNKRGFGSKFDTDLKFRKTKPFYHKLL